MHTKIYSLGGFLPVPVIAVPRLPGRLVGVCLGPFVLLAREYANDWPTVVHELEHCKQFWRGGLIIHFARYYLSRSYRLKAELEAYRAELDACPPGERAGRLDDSARALVSGYQLKLDTEACRSLLLAGGKFSVKSRKKSGQTLNHRK